MYGKEKIFCAGTPGAAKAEQKSLVLARQAQRSIQGRTPFICRVLVTSVSTVSQWSVPSSELGPPTPYPARECGSPPKTLVKGNKLGWGGDPIRTAEQKAWPCVYSVAAAMNVCELFFSLNSINRTFILRGNRNERDCLKRWIYSMENQGNPVTILKTSRDMKTGLDVFVFINVSHKINLTRETVFLGNSYFKHP